MINCMLEEYGVRKETACDRGGYCKFCGWNKTEFERRAEDVKKHGLKSKYSLWKKKNPV